VVRVISKESRRLVLPRTSCFLVCILDDEHGPRAVLCGMHFFLRGDIDHAGDVLHVSH
jgi:hypothetical protein